MSPPSTTTSTLSFEIFFLYDCCRQSGCGYEEVRKVRLLSGGWRQDRGREMSTQIAKTRCSRGCFKCGPRGTQSPHGHWLPGGIGGHQTSNTIQSQIWQVRLSFLFVHLKPLAHNKEPAARDEKSSHGSKENSLTLKCHTMKKKKSYNRKPLTQQKKQNWCKLSTHQETLKEISHKYTQKNQTEQKKNRSVKKYQNISHRSCQKQKRSPKKGPHRSKTVSDLNKKPLTGNTKKKKNSHLADISCTHRKNLSHMNANKKPPTCNKLSQLPKKNLHS